MASTIPLLETLEIKLSATGVVELAFSRPKRYNALSALAYRVSWTILYLCWILILFLKGLACCYTVGCHL